MGRQSRNLRKGRNEDEPNQRQRVFDSARRMPADINVSKYAVEIVGFSLELGGGGVALLHFVFCCIGLSLTIVAG